MNIELQVDQYLAAMEAQYVRFIAENRELVDQFKKMQQAIAATEVAAAKLECIRERRRLGRNNSHEVAVNQITSMSITAQAQWAVDNHVVPFKVCITRIGEGSVTKRLCLLDDVERDALIRYWWDIVPVSIKSLADDPEIAFARYVMGNIRGVNSEGAE